MFAFIAVFKLRYSATSHPLHRRQALAVRAVDAHLWEALVLEGELAHQLLRQNGLHRMALRGSDQDHPMLLREVEPLVGAVGYNSLDFGLRRSQLSKELRAEHRPQRHKAVGADLSESLLRPVAEKDEHAV